MAYQTELDGGQTIFLEQQGEQTSVQVHGNGQRQGSSVQTGAWKSPPRLYRVDGGVLLEIQAEPAVYYRLEGGQLHSLDEAPALGEAEQIDLKEVPDGSDDSKMKPMEKMEPMKPMKPM
ncbi:hypothetical protein [Deinococcus altitudinis]|uniref:hypothetical protein n=1 Tax=Deinococcus altitudinis TaxID=468914 RepID=UPI0038912EA6